MNNNKLIAEFMGVHDEISLDSIAGNIHSWCDAPFFYITEDSKEKVMEGIAEYSKYHTSWDWLMPVVEKIEEIAIDDDNLTVKEHRYQVDMSYTQCSIYDHVRDGVIASADMGTKLSSTHRAVIEFIKEYNNG
jgi:hypothetical protein